jgi:hypothetical protein
MQTDKLIIITTDEYKRGQTNTVPFLGTIDIDHEGKTYLDPSRLKDAEALEGRNINFFVYKEGVDYSPKKPEVKKKAVLEIQKIPEEHLEKLVNHPDIINYFTEAYASKFITLQEQVESLKDEKEQYIQFTQELQLEIEKKDNEIEELNKVLSLENFEDDSDLIKPQTEQEDDLSKKKIEVDPIKPQTQESEILSVDQFLKDKVEAKYTVEQKKMIDVINSKSVEDLRKKFCSVYPLKEWKDLKGKQVKDYLIKKLQKA